MGASLLTISYDLLIFPIGAWLRVKTFVIFLISRIKLLQLPMLKPDFGLGQSVSFRRLWS